MPDRSYLTKLINCEAIITQPLPLTAFIEKQLTVDVLRLDLIHPVISGNKFFKLKVAITNAINHNVPGIISFGGAYSNHLVALAYLCKEAGMRLIGIVRGEHSTLSPTLEDAVSYGMIPVFLSRNDYAAKDTLDEYLGAKYPGFLIIPEGGRSPEGVEGAKEITSLVNAFEYDTITCAVGTGTMMAGIVQNAAISQQVLGVLALKLPPSNDVEEFIRIYGGSKSYTINYDYHFGGYARKSQALIDFMNSLWQQHKLPTDFVYTAKLVYGIRDLAAKDYFKPGARILIVHSGGLQGNRSIADSLVF